MNKTRRIVLTGGGSAGHLFPLVAVAEELKKKEPSIELLYIGSRAQFGAKAEEIMTAQGIPTKNVLAGKLRRYFSLHYFVDLFKAPLGVLQSLWHLLVFMPDTVFSKGGYVSVPVVIAAWLYRIPVLTHESDAIPGWANRLIGKFSRFVAISYPSSADYFLASKVVLTGNPIRKELTQGDAQRGRTRWHFSESRPVVFVVGGSQGAQAINDVVVSALPELARKAQVLHVTGENNYEATVHAAGSQGIKSGHDHYFAKGFFDREEMADAYALADVVVSRAGANSVTEIAANKKPSILIPLPSHDQPANAGQLSAAQRSSADYDPLQAHHAEKSGGALVLEQSNLGPHLLMRDIDKILTDEQLRTGLINHVASFYHADAAQKIAEGIFLLMQKNNS